MKVKEVLRRAKAPREVFNFYREQRRLEEEITLPSDEEINEIASLFKCLANPVRLKLLLLLSKPHCVCMLSYLTGLDITLISHHLAKLKMCGLVKVKSKARIRIYKTDTRKIKHLITVLTSLLK